MATRPIAQDPKVDELRRITSTDQLVAFLRDRLDWPIEAGDVEDVFFDWEPEELGLSEDFTDCIEGIRQLRPLVAGQPWGIFFVEFGRKRLPIVALRRLLNSLAIKRRASARKGGGHQTWLARDLLFVSSFGDAQHREIALAHFTDESEHGDLPVLRVLGWDEDDTNRQLEKVAATLQTRLRWPGQTDGVAAQLAWREQWGAAFTLQYRQAINDAKSLALALADLAKRIRLRANDVLAAESERGHLRKLHQAFKDNLIADLPADGFADMFAQTIAYGLFTAHVSRGSGALVADDVAEMVPSTNPFLRDLLKDFLQAAGRARQRNQRVDFDELGINDVVQTLRRAPMDDILRSFNADRPGDDPVIHFYEDFLKAYDKKMRAQRGVFYTPRPVVSFIVRSVHEILQTEFGIEDGLASIITWGEMRQRRPDLALPPHTTDDMPFVQVLDPAIGTGTFLVEVISLIYEHLHGQWAKQGFVSKEQTKGLWNDYVRRHLLPRLHGFELMMAPYAIAHMKIGLKLAETGYTFPEDGPRLNVYLTNALEPAHALQPQLDTMAPMLAHEARSANRAKERLAATVVVGNPPYSGISGNMFPWINGLLKGRLPDGTVVQSYYRIDGQPLGEKKVWLQDDYVKFIRFGQWRIECAGIGVLGYITNHGYLDNPTFRGMRRCLMNTFGRIDVIDLHGNSKKKEKAPDGTKDENVFDIEQGVSIGLLRTSGATAIRHMDLFGTRAIKYQILGSGSMQIIPVMPVSPYYFLAPLNAVADDTYDTFWPVPSIAPRYGLGFQTSRDDLVVGFDRLDLARKIEHFVSAQRTDDQVRQDFFGSKKVADYKSGDTRQWTLTDARRNLRNTEWHQDIRTVLYRPFDWRSVLYRADMVDWPRPDILGHMLHLNIALLVNRQTKDDFATLCATDLTERKIAARYDASSTFPLWVYLAGANRIDLHDDDLISALPGRCPNLNISFIGAIIDATGLSTTDWQPERRSAPLHAENIFHYIYAVLHSPSYRTRYAGFLSIDFPRIPIPATYQLFAQLAPLGAQLMKWHLLEHPSAIAINSSSAPAGLDVPAFFGSDRRLVQVAEKSRAMAATCVVASKSGRTTSTTVGKVFINGESGFENVNQQVWQHTIGGYQVLHKWLDDRRKAGRSLSDDDIAHWRRIYASLQATQALMAQVDQVIDVHGGWPDGPDETDSTRRTAFSTNHPPPDPATLAAQQTPVRRARFKPAVETQHGLPFAADDADKASEAVTPDDDADAPDQPIRPAAIDDADAMRALRKVLGEQGPLSGEDLLKQAAYELGYRRMSGGARETLDDAVRRAVRRGVAENDANTLRLPAHLIEDQDRDFLKEQFLAALSALSRGWVERDDALQAFKAWMGYGRLGAVIENTTRSLVQGLLQQRGLEAQGSQIRRVSGT